MKKKRSVNNETTGHPVDKDTIHNLEISDNTWSHTDGTWGNIDATWNKIMDALPHDLIQPSRTFNRNAPVHLETSLISDKSTSRALEIMKEDTSENTRLAHRGDLVYWQAWLNAIGFNFNEPLTERIIITFIVQHVEGLDNEVDKKLVAQGSKQKLGPHKLSTVKRRVASLSVCLTRANAPNPCHSKAISALCQKLTKKYGCSTSAGKAITKDILNEMLETCNDKLIDIRDKALLLFAWGSGGRRRSEVVAADMKNLTKSSDGNFVYTITHSKTDQGGNGNTVPLRGRVAKELQNWLDASNITEGNIFRSVRKADRIGGTLNGKEVNRIVKRRLNRAGYDETKYGAHSLRSGFVTEAGRKNKPLGDVMAMTTHRSVSTIMRYYQAGNIINNKAANLADNE